MEIHKPKPVHSWREFLGEIGTIVIGVLIALGAEQAVEHLHERHLAAEAHAAIRAEIATNLGQLEARSLTEACVTRRLEEVEQLIGPAGASVAGPIWIGRPVTRTIRDSQYRSQAEAGRLNLLPNAEQASYAEIYAAFQEYARAEAEEQPAWADLRVLEGRPALSEVAEWQLRSAVQRARTARWSLESTLYLIEQAAVRAGIQPGKIPKFSEQSVCIPLHTPRKDALVRVAAGRTSGGVYDEP